MPREAKDFYQRDLEKKGVRLISHGNISRERLLESAEIQSPRCDEVLKSIYKQMDGLISDGGAMTYGGEVLGMGEKWLMSRDPVGVGRAMGDKKLVVAKWEKEVKLDIETSLRRGTKILLIGAGFDNNVRLKPGTIDVVEADGCDKLPTFWRLSAAFEGLIMDKYKAELKIEERVIPPGTAVIAFWEDMARKNGPGQEETVLPEPIVESVPKVKEESVPEKIDAVALEKLNDFRNLLTRGGAITNGGEMVALAANVRKGLLKESVMVVVPFWEARVKRIIPEGVRLGKDGAIYVTDSQIKQRLYRTVDDEGSLKFGCRDVDDLVVGGLIGAGTEMIIKVLEEKGMEPKKAIGVAERMVKEMLLEETEE